MPSKVMTQTFNDGTVVIYSVGENGGDGDMPKDELVEKARLRFRRRTVGLTRSNLAQQVGVRVDGLIRCPYHPAVSPQDVAIMEGDQFRIRKVQRPEDITPPVMDLELSRLEQKYEV